MRLSRRSNVMMTLVVVLHTILSHDVIILQDVRGSQKDTRLL